MQDIQRPVVSLTPAPDYGLSELLSGYPLPECVQEIGTYAHRVRSALKVAQLVRDCRAARRAGLRVNVEWGVWKEFQEAHLGDEIAMLGRKAPHVHAIEGDEPLNMLRHPRNLWVSRDHGGGHPTGGHAGWTDDPLDVAREARGFTAACHGAGFEHHLIEAWPWAPREVWEAYLPALFTEGPGRPDRFVLDMNLFRLDQDSRRDKAGRARRAADEELRTIAALCSQHEMPIGVVLGGAVDPRHGLTPDGFLRSAEDQFRHFVDVVGHLPNAIQAKSWGWHAEGEPEDRSQPPIATMLELARRIGALLGEAS